MESNAESSGQPAPAPSPSSRLPLACCIAICFFLAMLGRHLVLGQAHPSKSGPDMPQYVGVAQRIIEGNGYSEMRDGRIVPHFYRTPVYPCFLALCMSVSSENWQWLVVGVQAGFHLAAALALLRFAGIALRIRGARVFCFVAYLLNPAALLAITSVLTDSLFVSSVTILLAFIGGRLIEAKRSSAHSAWVGFALGATALIRPIAQYLGLLWATATYIAHPKPAGRSQAVQLAAIFLACLIAAPAAWMTRNFARGGSFNLAPLTGYNLALGMMPVIRAWPESKVQALPAPERQIAEALRREREYVKGLVAGRTESGLDDFKTDRALASIAKRAILDRPGYYASEVVRRSIENFAPGEGFLLFLESAGIPPKVTRYGLRNSISDRQPVALGTAVITRGVFAGLYIGLPLLGIASWFRRRGRFPWGWLFISHLFYFEALIALIGPTNERIALPLLPSLCLFGAIGLEVLIGNRFRLPPRTSPA